MEHLSADVAQLAELGVGDALDGTGIIYDLGVGHKEAGDIRPVFVDIGIQRRRRQRAGDVAAAAGEGVDAAVGHDAVEAGDDHPAAGGRPAEVLVALVLIYRAVQPELQPQGAVQKVKAQVVSHEPGGKILAPGHQLIGADALFHFGAERVELLLQRSGQMQGVPDLQIAAADHIEHAVAADAVLQVGVAQVQQVGDLMVVLEPLAGSTDHHHAAAGVSLHDGADLCELGLVRHGRAAEFQHF